MLNKEQLLKFEVLTISKKIILQVQRNNAMSNQTIESIKKGEFKMVGWFDTDIIDWHTSCPHVVLIEKGRGIYRLYPWWEEQMSRFGISTIGVPQIFIK